MNLIDRGKVLQGIAEVRDGITFSLSLPLNVGYWLNPGRTGPRFAANSAPDGEPFMNYPLRRLCAHYTDVVCDDAVTLDLQFSTQWDALGHVGSHFDADADGIAEVVYYNGYPAAGTCGGGDCAASSHGVGPDVGSAALGIDNLARAGMQGRAVMLDFAHHFGLEPKSVGYADLMMVIERDAIEIESGDMVCLRTGLDRYMLEHLNTTMPQVCPGASLNGRDERLLQWIGDSNLAAIISDHPAVETYPPLSGPDATHALLGLHELCLFKLGIPLGELWFLSPLADWLRTHGRSRFLLTAPPLNLPGAAGSPVTPIATV